MVTVKSNFYRTINKKWLDKAKIPKSKTSHSNFSEIQDMIDRRLKTIVSNERLFLNIIELYRRRNLDVSEVFPLITKLLKATTFEKQIALCNIYEFESPITIYISSDDKQSTKYSLCLNQGGLFLPSKEYYEDSTDDYSIFLTKLINMINKCFKSSGTKLPQIRSSSDEIIKFEKQIAKLHTTATENRDVVKTYNPIQISSSDILSKIMIHYGIPVEYHDRTVILRSKTYHNKVMKSIKSLPKQTWDDYLIISVFLSSINVMSTKFEKLFFDFYGKYLNGIQKQSPSWRKEINAVTTVVGNNVSEIYRKMYFNKKEKTDVEELIQVIKTSLQNSITNNKWMSKNTKKLALTKLHKMKTKIGYPDKPRLFSSKKSFETYFEMYIYVLNKDRLRTVRLWKTDTPVNKNEWSIKSYDVNAYYIPNDNTIVFPAGILQTPFYDLKQTVPQNFGGIGSIIGHEITHGFDDQGCHFDGDGNMNAWWSKRDMKEYKKRTNIIIKQYDTYFVKGKQINGHLTLGENLADIGGLNLAYRAMLTAIDGVSDEQKIKSKKEFMEHWAMIWRTKQTTESVMLQMTTDPHSPAEWRVNGGVSSMDDFYKLYDVTKNDKMWIDPKQRISLW